jgi:hypothetical protein
MTAQALIAAAFPGQDPTVLKARVALLRLMRALAWAEVYADEVAPDLVALAVSDPSLVFSKGDLPEIANALGTVFIATGHELHRARDAFIDLRLEWSRFEDSHSAGTAGTGDDRNSGRKIPPDGDDTELPAGDDCPF